MKLPTCAICGRDVLELNGQFELNDSYLLEPGDPSDVPDGWVHVPCLLDSIWGAWWAQRKRTNRAARKLTVLGSAPGIVAHRTGDRREVLIARDDGLDLHLRARDLERAGPIDGGVLVPTRGEYNLHLEGREVLAREIAARVEAGDCTVPWLVERLGLSDRIHEPRALEGGTFVKHPDLPVIGTSTVVGIMSYATFVPAPMWALVAPAPPSPGAT